MEDKIVTDFRELCDIFEYYGYQTILDDEEMKHATEIIMTYKRMVFVYPIFIDMLDAYQSYFKKYFNFDLRNIEEDALLVVFKHDDDIMNILTTNINLFRNYIFKVKLVSPCDICFEDKTDGYKCSRCKNEICLDCYNAIKNNYCNKCIYCNYSLLDHIARNIAKDVVK